MTIENIIQEIISVVKSRYNGKLAFDTPIVIKKTPHSFPVKIIGLQVDSDGILWTIDVNKEWSKLEPMTADANLISNSVLQRIKSLSSVNSFEQRSAIRSDSKGML
jgi:hypothetical protein